MFYSRWLRQKKMSKSLSGNTVAPSTCDYKVGCWYLALVGAIDCYRSEIAVSDGKFLKFVLADAYRRFRNTARFLLANIWMVLTPATDLVPTKWISRIRQVECPCGHYSARKLCALWKNNDLWLSTKNLLHFCSIEFGSFYLEYHFKIVNYTAKKMIAHARRSCSNRLAYHIIEGLVRWILAPIMSFLPLRSCARITLAKARVCFYRRMVWHPQ